MINQGPLYLYIHCISLVCGCSKHRKIDPRLMCVLGPTEVAITSGFRQLFIGVRVFRPVIPYVKFPPHSPTFFFNAPTFNPNPYTLYSGSRRSCHTASEANTFIQLLVNMDPSHTRAIIRYMCIDR